MKTHSFDVEDAVEHGVHKAIILHHLKFHQQANEGHNCLEHKGRTWAFLKPETIEKMYPYFNYSSIKRWLKELEEEGIITSCKPRAKHGDHLKYYHVLEVDEPISQNENSNSQITRSGSRRNGDSSYINDEEMNEEKNMKKSGFFDDSVSNGEFPPYTIDSETKWNGSSPIDYESFVDFFNEVTEGGCRMSPGKKRDIEKQLKTFTGQEIKKALQNRALILKDSEYLSSWESVFSRKIERMEKYLTANPSKSNGQSKPAAGYYEEDYNYKETELEL